MTHPLRIHAQIIRKDLPVLVGASLLLSIFLFNGALTRIEGGILLGGLLAYTVLSVVIARKEARQVQAEFTRSVPDSGRSIWLDLAYVAGGLVLLVLGARALVAGAVDIAQGLGISDAVIGLTVVALGTSLPELATSVLAALKGEGDIAVGNVVGSNLFNIFGILSTTALIHPLRNTGVTHLDLGVMLALAVVLLPLMRTGFRLVRWEGALLVLAYLAYLAFLLAGH
jgi:cation:H+ antiporter